MIFLLNILRGPLKYMEPSFRATVKVAPTYLYDIHAFVGATFTVALYFTVALNHANSYCFLNTRT
jgi:hypothetical protein